MAITLNVNLKGTISMKHKLKNVRLSFASIFNRSQFNGEEGKFEATFLLDKEAQQEAIKALEDDIKSRIETSFKGTKLKPENICLKDGDDFEYEGYAGNMSIKGSSNKRPIIVDRDKSPLVEDDGKPYSGCYVNAVVDLWTQNNAFGKRVNCNLLAVQFFKDGEAFGAAGGSASVDDFDMFEEDEDDDLAF